VAALPPGRHVACGGRPAGLAADGRAAGLPADTQAEELDNDLRLSNRPTLELRLDVAAAIGSLPPHYREVVLLRDVEEMTVDEIGAALALTREAVKARLHRARALLREYLLR